MTGRHCRWCRSYDEIDAALLGSCGKFIFQRCRRQSLIVKPDSFSEEDVLFDSTGFHTIGRSQDVSLTLCPDWSYILGTIHAEGIETVLLLESGSLPNPTTPTLDLDKLDNFGVSSVGLVAHDCSRSALSEVCASDMSEVANMFPFVSEVAKRFDPGVEKVLSWTLLS